MEDHSINLIPNDVVKKATLEIVANILNTPKFYSYLERGSEAGDNYIGIVYRGKFRTLEDHNESIKSKKESPQILDLIIKVPPENKNRREQFFTVPCFTRESLVYNEILPMFMKFQESKGIIPSEDGFHEYAYCYRTITEEFNEVIILKDLCPEGFEMYSRHSFTTAEHINIVMKILAKLHAISFAMKDQCPEKIERFKKLEEIFAERKDSGEFTGYLNTLKDRAISTLCPKSEQHVIDKIKSLFEGKDFMNALLETTNGQHAEPYAVICHGDCWNNNILYKNENGHPVDACLIDWQITRYASPVCDLMYYIFLASSQEIRQKHYKEFMNTYYNELSMFIRRLGSNPEKLFSRQAFDEQLIKYGHFGLMMGFMLLPMLTTPKEDIPDLDEMSQQIADGTLDIESFKSEKSEDAYQERTRGLLIDMVEYGYA